MANIEANVDSLINISKMVRDDQIKTLRISVRKSGVNRGKLWIDWTEKEPSKDERFTRLKRQRIAEVITRAAILLSEHKSIVFDLTKMSVQNDHKYNYKLEVK